MHIKSNFIEVSRFEAKFQKLKDVNFSFFFDYTPTDAELRINPINIWAHDEPDEYFGHHKWIEQNYHKFDLVLTWSQRILYKCENARLLLFGESWIDDLTGWLPEKKKFEISFIKGLKLLSAGHILRKQIYDRQDEIKIPHKFFESTDTSTFDKCRESKFALHDSSMFSLIIENTSHHNYFTEKLTDCLVMKTIPVYWGCTNIEKYFPDGAIIQIHSDDDAIHKINKLTENVYHDHKDQIQANYQLAKNTYNGYISRITGMIEKMFQINGLI